MPRVSQTWILLTSIAVGLGADKEAKFTPGPASSYPHKQTNEKVTIAAAPFEGDEETKAAFGKLNPNKHGILPVLLVIQNDTGQGLRLDQVRVEYVTRDRERIEATPAKEVPYVSGAGRPKYSTGPFPSGGARVGRNKNPLADPAIDVRSFAAKMLPAGQSASGFVYFQTGHRGGSQIYLTGIREAASGRELFYFEIPLGNPR